MNCLSLLAVCNYSQFSLIWLQLYLPSILSVIWHLSNQRGFYAETESSFMFPIYCRNLLTSRVRITFITTGPVLCSTSIRLATQQVNKWLLFWTIWWVDLLLHSWKINSESILVAGWNDRWLLKRTLMMHERHTNRSDNMLSLLRLN